MWSGLDWFGDKNRVVCREEQREKKHRQTLVVDARSPVFPDSYKAGISNWILKLDTTIVGVVCQVSPKQTLAATHARKLQKKSVGYLPDVSPQPRPQRW